MSLIDDIRKDREDGKQTTSLAEAQRMIERRDTALLAADEAITELRLALQMAADDWTRFEKADRQYRVYRAATGAS